MFVRRLGNPPSPPTPHPAALQRPSPSLMLPPPVPPVVAAPWNGGGGSMTGSRGAPLVTNSDGGAGVWPPGFAFDFDIALPRAPQLPPGTSYAVARRDAFLLAANLGPRSSPPRMRGRRLAALECPRNSQWRAYSSFPAWSDESWGRSSPSTGGAYFAGQPPWPGSMPP
jgi:hypothetical protein